MVRSHLATLLILVLTSAHGAQAQAADPGDADAPAEVDEVIGEPFGEDHEAAGDEPGQGDEATGDVGEAGPQRVTWEELVEEVERTSPLMEAARSGLDTFESKLREAHAARFPVFELQAGIAPSPAIRDEDEDGRYFVDLQTWGYLYRVNLKFAQPLFTFGKLRGLKRAARHGMDVGRAQVETARWELRYRAAQAWYGALLGRELRDILEEGSGWLDKAKARMERLRAEDSPEYDQMEHLRLKARMAEFFELEAQNNRVDNKARHGLRLLLSREAGKPVTPAPDALDPVDFELLPATRYLDVAMGTAPELRVARAGRKAREDLAAVEQAKLWPDFALVADARITESNVIGEEVEVGNENVGVSAGFLFALRWTLDFGTKLARRDQARAGARRAARQAQAARDLLELEVRDLHQQLEDKQGLIEVYAESRKAAKGWLQATWDLYDTGFGSFKEVMDALVQFYGKRLGYLQAVHDHNLLVWELSRTIGADVTALEPRPGDAPGPGEQTVDEPAGGEPID